MRNFVAVFVGGAVGLVVLKIFLGLLAPLFAMVFGLVALVIKLALFAAVAYFIYALLKGKKREPEVEV